MPPAELRLLILAPRGRDATIAAELLRRHALDCHACGDMPALIRELDAGAGAAMLTEEALAGDAAGLLAAWVATQPPWSDLPFVVLGNGGRAPRSAAASATLTRLGNVVLLERPLHADAMVGAARSALQARRRQYEVRQFSDTLEASVEARTRELAAARETLEIALDAAGMGGWDIDLATGHADRTLRHDQIFGYATLQPDWTIDRFLTHVADDDRAMVGAALDAAPGAGGVTFECRIIAVDGAERWISVSGRVRHDDGGRPTRLTGVIADITERKDAAARLAQAQKMDAMGQLTGGGAHDFNNLLTPIVGNLDMLRRRVGGDPKAERLIGGALMAAERAATLTQRLLTFSRRQTLVPRAVDVAALIDGMTELVRRSLGPTIEVRVDAPAGPRSARVDPGQLELALLNLAINARDAMPDGGWLTLAVEERRVGGGVAAPAGLAAGDYLRVSATDTGVGMDAATLARATEPFFTTKGIGKGTGLGLSMAHGLAAQSGGALEIVSRPGHGSTMALWLPATDEIAAVVPPSAQAPPPRRAARVLLVDDEALVRAATAEMLRDTGHVVVEAASARHAIAALRRDPAIEVMVTDYLMPGMTGAVLIAELRRDAIDRPTLLITGYADANAGADVPPDVPRLAKPFRQQELVDGIERALSAGASIDKLARSGAA